MNSTLNIADALRWARVALSAGESPQADAEVLLTWVLGRNRAYLRAFDDLQLSDTQWLQYQTAVERRQCGEPVAYIMGVREFWSLPLRVEPSTLIPRPDTETLVEVALLQLSATQARVLDLGTGTGAIALALASERPGWQVTGVDRLPEAVALARKNAMSLQLNVAFLLSHWYAQVTGAFDLIVSNPPYIDSNDPHLLQGDVRFEPHSALVAADQGLADITCIVDHAPGYLTDGGWILLEHGWQQAESVQLLLRQKGFSSVQSWQDLGGNDRVTGGRWCGEQSVVAGAGSS
ncbi:peptide chain release factor N(5)-glutamine methyltransferase [Pokkaliibacter plantistimulans]|uniref:peptide chain release factor N(5)-glutamine methyltransferase n=1 Tax=Pokkaliibacter plantistimulans TaxID=1635171 RepID=UPI002434542B|nr:peptide chain release factor N(5)-glutamine methyltransferase [Pokkaliibacter plantistimulans]